MFQEVAECNAGTPEAFQGLVQPEDTERVLNGYAVRTPRRIDPETQTALAERAFAGNGFLVLVGDRQVTDPDEEDRAAARHRGHVPEARAPGRWLMSCFRTPRSHMDRLRNRITDGDIARVADEALRVMDSSRGAWGGGRQGVLDRLRALSTEYRRQLLHALADRFQQAGDDTEARCRHLALCALVAEGLDGSESLADDPLAAERRKAWTTSPAGSPSGTRPASRPWAGPSLPRAVTSRPPSWPSSAARPWTPTARTTSSGWPGSSPSPSSTSARHGPNKP